MKHRLHIYDINRDRSRHGQKYANHKEYLSMMVFICVIDVFICIKQHLTTFEAQFMEKLGTTEAELKKKIA